MTHPSKLSKMLAIVGVASLCWLASDITTQASETVQKTMNGTKVVVPPDPKMLSVDETGYIHYNSFLLQDMRHYATKVFPQQQKDGNQLILKVMRDPEVKEIYEASYEVVRQNWLKEANTTLSRKAFNKLVYDYAKLLNYLINVKARGLLIDGDERREARVLVKNALLEQAFLPVKGRRVVPSQAQFNNLLHLARKNGLECTFTKEDYRNHPCAKKPFFPMYIQQHLDLPTLNIPHFFDREQDSVLEQVQSFLMENLLKRAIEQEIRGENVWQNDWSKFLDPTLKAYMRLHNIQTLTPEVKTAFIQEIVNRINPYRHWIAIYHHERKHSGFNSMHDLIIQAVYNLDEDLNDKIDHPQNATKTKR